MTSAAIYCLSSKKPGGLGVGAQRKELRAYAQANGLHIVAKFSDMGISESLDEISQPGLAKLLGQLGTLERSWKVLLAVDRNHVAQDPMLALYLERECEHHGVEVRYSRVFRDSEDVVAEILLAQLRVFDHFHRRIRAQTGRLVLQDNVAKGFRSGGPAPLGYKTSRVLTKGTRAGVPAVKSKLIVDAGSAKKVADFLHQRAAGVPRSAAAKVAGLGNKTQGSLKAIERNALLYAGYTVWNQRRVHRPSRDDRRKTMILRPRSEWIISPTPTHKSLITRDEAELIVAGLDTARVGARGLKHRKADAYLLAGLLFAPDGTPWQADGKSYRLGGKPSRQHPEWGKRVSRAAVDQFVLNKIANKLPGNEFVAQAVRAAHAMARAIEDDPLACDEALRSVEAKIRRVTEAVAKTGLGSLRAKLNDLDTERSRLLMQRATVVEHSKLKAALRDITANQVLAMLKFGGVAGDGDVIYVRSALAALVERVELDPASRAVRLRWRVDVRNGQPDTETRLTVVRGRRRTALSATT